MNDTPKKIEELQFQMMMNLPAARRIELACEMYMSARKAAFASIPGNVSEVQRKNIFLKKMYGESLVDSILSDAPPIR
ncbi:MAG TPA: hypothetical protein VL327_11190 [Pyrinomonadaceae bacterium]|jgi:hypothetical protein|nr:hypothetical protein [Pyrinomonadaceae bacterium]